MHQDPQQPAAGGGRPVTGPAVEDHGRVVTANIAGRRLLSPSATGRGLGPHGDGAPSRGQADPAFGLAVADLDAITEAPRESHQRSSDELGTPSHRNSPHRGRRQHPVEPPTCSVNTSPTLAATHSLYASSQTSDSAWDNRVGLRTSAAGFPVAIPLDDSRPHDSPAIADSDHLGTSAPRVGNQGPS